jgi:predicted flap endonuclease-1-like 5' DNA nuclease
MALKINQLQGVSVEIASALKSAGLNNSDKLLAAIAQPLERAHLAERLGIAERSLLELANRADLARIKGIGQVYSDLLEFVGVDTVAELAQRNADNLYEKILSMAGEHMVQRVPRREQVADWIEQAKQLGRGIFY